MFKPFYCCFGLFSFWIFSFKDVQPGLFFYSNFQGFTYCSIFDFQGSLLLSVSAATRLVYQILFCLSTTFFIYFWTFLEVRAPFSRGVYYNSKYRTKCQQHFSTFFVFFKYMYYVNFFIYLNKSSNSPSTVFFTVPSWNGLSNSASFSRSKYPLLPPAWQRR